MRRSSQICESDDEGDNEELSLRALSPGVLPLSTVDPLPLRSPPFVGRTPSLSYYELHRTKSEDLNTMILQGTVEKKEEFQRVTISRVPACEVGDEIKHIASLLNSACLLRDKYVLPLDPCPDTDLSCASHVTCHDLGNKDPAWDPFQGDIPASSQHVCVWKSGVASVWEEHDSEEAKSAVYTATPIEEFHHDLRQLMTIVSSGPVKSYCHRRLEILEAKYQLHLLLNDDRELAAQRSVPHRDFYNVRKVDTHVHHSACMNQKHLLRFIKKKLKQEPDQIVIFRDGKHLTLKQVFESLNLTADSLSVDRLDMHADNSVMHRFDKFNLKYNPVGESRLREIFLKTDNLIQGRYLAEITKEVIADLQTSRYQLVEWRLSIYGRSVDEWDKLAKWVCQNQLASTGVRWMIQIPRIYSVFKQVSHVENFDTMLRNIFLPLFEVSINPSSHPELHVFLRQVVGFDSVDDESVSEQHQPNIITADEWSSSENPPYWMYIYYMWANLRVLNQLRAAKNMNIFSLRPHSGESGEVDHLATSFLLSNGINHGIMLRKSPVLQYLYYLKQIGIAVSPLSNNLLFVEYEKNPFPRFFARGLNVSLSTDDPLMIHFTKEPLVEEYSVAAQVWKLSSTDMCEIARNSVLQSGFEPIFKAHWLGCNYRLQGTQGNDINRTNVSNIRIQFRHETLTEEHDILQSLLPTTQQTD